MLSIPEYYILKKKLKDSKSSGHCALPYPRVIFLTTKTAPENKCLNTAEALTTLCSRK